MKSQNPLVKYALIIMALFIASCFRSESEEENKTGSIFGKVKLFDRNETELANKQGVIIEVLSGSKKFSSTSNLDGTFSLSEIPLGKLVINFKKANYGGFDSLRFTHNLPIDSLNFIELTEVPPANLKLKSIEFDERFVYVMCTEEFNSDKSYLSSNWFYFSKSPDVSSKKYDLFKRYCCVGGNTANPMGFGSTYQYHELYNAGFKRGDKIYVIAYPGNSKLITYENLEDGYKYGFLPTHGDNPSNVLSFILP